MRTHIAKQVAWQLAQEDQTQTVFSDIDVRVNAQNPEDSIVRCTYCEGAQVVVLVIDAVEE